jgi:hypothetical protein
MSNLQIVCTDGFVQVDKHMLFAKRVSYVVHLDDLIKIAAGELKSVKITSALCQYINSDKLPNPGDLNVSETIDLYYLASFARLPFLVDAVYAMLIDFAKCQSTVSDVMKYTSVGSQLEKVALNTKQKPI